MQLDINTIMWIAWGSALIIPLKIFFLVRHIRKKMAADEAEASKKVE
jgi:hypothetical protein